MFPLQVAVVRPLVRAVMQMSAYLVVLELVVVVAGGSQYPRHSFTDPSPLLLDKEDLTRTSTHHLLTKMLSQLQVNKNDKETTLPLRKRGKCYCDLDLFCFACRRKRAKENKKMQQDRKEDNQLSARLMDRLSLLMEINDNLLDDNKEEMTL